MATVTLGTTSTSALTALLQNAANAAADVAAIALLIKDDQNVARPIVPGAYVLEGMLFVPNRGVLRVLPGDFVGVDESGWPILVSAASIASGSTEWSHS